MFIKSFKIFLYSIIQICKKLRPPLLSIILGMYHSVIENIIFNCEIYILEECIKCVVFILKNSNKMRTHESIIHIKNRILLVPLKAPCVPLPNHAPLNHCPGYCIHHFFCSWFWFFYSFITYVCTPKQYIV